MRTGLLAALKRTESGKLRAELDFVGPSVLAWQVELLRSLGCERIICLCEAPGTVMLGIQRQIEAEGGEFHAVRGIPQLVSLLRTDELVIVVQDGLLADRSRVRDILQPKPRLARQVIAMPATSHLATDAPEDFERIDALRSWAGLSVLGAAEVHKLSDLPLDGDAISLILRIALQSGAKVAELSTDDLPSGEWILAKDEKALEQHERELIKSTTRNLPWSGPGIASATRLAPRLVEYRREKAPAALGAASILVMVAGAVLAGIGFLPGGLLTGAIGAFLAQSANEWERLKGALLGSHGYAKRWLYFNIITDTLAVLLLISALMASESSIAECALPIFAIGLANLNSGSEGKQLSTFWRDRALHLMLFALLAGVGLLSEGIALLGLLGLGQLLLRVPRN